MVNSIFNSYLKSKTLPIKIGYELQPEINNIVIINKNNLKWQDYIIINK